MTRWVSCPGQEAFVAAATMRILALLREGLEQREEVHLALAGGGTPRPVHERMAREGGGLDWTRIHLWWGDERCVPPDHPRSNFRMAAESLLSPLAELGRPIPAGNLHPVRGDLPPPEASARYADELLQHLGPGTPRLDLALLGMGADGHTASLFPGSPALEAPGWTAPAVGPGGEPRVTLTLATLRQARAVLFLVSRQGKEEALAEIQGGGSALPAALVQAAGGEPTWLVLEP